MLRLPVSFFSFFFQHACYSSKYEDSAPSATNGVTSSIVPAKNSFDDNDATTSVVSSVEEAPTATTSAALSPSGSLNDDRFQRIVSAVSEAVLATIQGTGPSTPPPPNSLATTELVEVPIVESGSALSHQATVSASVVSVLHVTGEANFIQVSPSSQPALPTFYSVNVPNDANVSPKIKTKIWVHEFIDFGI